MTSIVATHQIRDAFYVATHEAVRTDGRPQIRAASEATAQQAMFMVLHEGRIYFEGTAAALLASRDGYLREFLLKTLPPVNGACWALDVPETFGQLHSTAEGLSEVEAADRLRAYRPNEIGDHRPLSRVGVLARQFRSPLRLLLVSSVFDLLTFAALIGIFLAAQPTFRTSWFVESLLTDGRSSAIGPARCSSGQPSASLRSPSPSPYLPFAGVFGFVPLPWALLAAVAAVTALYVVATELAKRWFYGSRHAVAPRKII